MRRILDDNGMNEWMNEWWMRQNNTEVSDLVIPTHLGILPVPFIKSPFSQLSSLQTPIYEGRFTGCWRTDWFWVLKWLLVDITGNFFWSRTFIRSGSRGRPSEGIPKKSTVDIWLIPSIHIALIHLTVSFQSTSSSLGSHYYFHQVNSNQFHLIHQFNSNQL